MKRAVWLVVLAFFALGVWACKKEEKPGAPADPKASAPADPKASAPADPKAGAPVEAKKAAAPAAAKTCATGEYKNEAPFFCFKVPEGYKLEKPPTAADTMEYVFRAENFSKITIRVAPLARYDEDVKDMAGLITPENFDKVGGGAVAKGTGQFLHYRNKGDSAETIYAYYKGTSREYLCLIDALHKDQVKPAMFDACKNMTVE